MATSAILLSQPLGLQLLAGCLVSSSSFPGRLLPPLFLVLWRLWAPLIGAIFAAETGWDAPDYAAQVASPWHLFPWQQGQGL